MSEHERIRELLPLAASGDLTPGEMRRVDEHVALCAACRRASKELAALGDALRALPTPQPPAELVARVYQLGKAQLEPGGAPRHGAALLAPLVAASWLAALATWPLVRAEFHWLVEWVPVPGGAFVSTLAAYSILGFVLACASALAVGMRAREIGRLK